MSYLTEIAIFLCAAVILVPLAKQFKLGAVLGYLAAGIAIGPHALKLITDVEAILHLSEFGVVLLLFVIGLELQPSRLWVLRRAVFGLGAAQMIAVGTVIALIARSFGLDWSVAVLVGLTLAMSSTALVLPTLAERSELQARHGRDAFAILLFQDLAVIPLLALLPAIAPAMKEVAGKSNLLLQAAAIIGVVAAGRYLIRPFFHWLARLGGREIFTAGALLVVIAVSLLMTTVGLSMTLGAFLAGVLLADSEFRHEIETAINPFESLLLGLFFIAVGMSANFALLREIPVIIVGFALGLMLVKGLVLYAVRRIAKGANEPSQRLAVALAQGGEFAFVLLALMAQGKLLDQRTVDIFVMTVTLSMILTPLAFIAYDKIAAVIKSETEPAPFDVITDPGNPVVIAGFGRFGQIVGRILTARKINFTAIDVSPEQVEFVRKFGNKVYYGDASHLPLLHAAKVEEAKLFILAIDNVDASVKAAELMRKHYPHVPIIARVRNRLHAYRLMDLGVDSIIRDTYFSSLEAARRALRRLGMEDDQVEMSVARFRAFDEGRLMQQHAIYKNEEALIKSGKQGLEELESLFQSDAETVAVNAAAPQ